MENINPFGIKKDPRKSSLSQFEAAKKSLASRNVLTTNPTPQEMALARLGKPIQTKQFGISRRRRNLKHKKNKKTIRKSKTSNRW